MTREERMMWVCFMLMALILGWSCGRVVPRETAAAPPSPELLELTARVKVLEAAPPAPRCFNVTTTGKVDLAIFPVERLK